MHAQTRAIIACAVTAICAYAPGQALPSLPDVVRTQAQNQQQIREDTTKAAEDLSNIIAEFERNGLGDEADVKVLKAIRGVLGSLSQKEMAQVVALLESARAASDKGTATKGVVDALGQEKTIIIQLREVVLEYQRQQELADLSLRFSRLATDQNRNMKAARELAKSTRGKNYTDEQSAILKVQKLEQAAIREQVSTLLTKLATLAKSADQASAEKIKRVLDDADGSRLLETLTQSVADLDAGKLFSAAARERVARDKCRDLSRLMAAAPDAATVLRDGIAALNTQVSEQNEILTGANQTPANDPARTEDLSDKQADLVDSADVLKKDIANVAPDGAELVDAAIGRMQEARAAYGNNLKGAIAQAKDATSKLEAARDRLAEQLAALQKQNPDKMAQMQNLKEQITALQGAQEKLKKDTLGQADTTVLAGLNTRQGELLKKAREIVPLAPADTPGVGQALGEAANDMDQAQTALGTNADADGAVRPQQSAITDLAKALKLLDSEATEIAKAHEDLKKLEDARDEVAKAMEDQQKVQAQADQVAARKGQNPEQKKSATSDVAQKQSAVAANMDQVQKDVQNATKPDAQDASKAAAQNDNDAARDVQQAAKDMKDAQDAAKRQDAQAAADEAKNALDDLARAKDALDQQIADAQKQMGAEPEATPKLDDVAQQLDQAQKELADAQQQLQNADQQQEQPNQADAAHPDQQKGDAQQEEQQAAQKLEQAAADVTKARAEDKGALPQQADDALDKARDAMAKAGAAAAEHDAKDAREQAQKAQEAMAQAHAAIAMAKSGIRQNTNHQGKPANHQQQADAAAQTKGEHKSQQTKPGQSDDPQQGNKSAVDTRVSGDGASGSSAFLGLPARERQAILQDQAEKYPEEYGPMIEKYTKNLADSAR